MRRRAGRSSRPPRRAAASGPVTAAWCSSAMSTLAPIRRSSLIHSRRSSKIVSWMRLVPLRLGQQHRRRRLEVRREARVGCRLDVGRRGSRRTSAPHRDRVALAARSTRPPVPSTSRNAPSWPLGAPCSVTSPPVTAAATMNVPASMRSGSTRVLGAAQPSAALHLDAVGRACARPRRPSRCRKSMRSSTSGSWAAGQMVVWPSARVAASIAFSVPITVTPGNITAAPRRRPGRAREVVAVAVLDVRAQGAHRVDVQVHGSPADAVAAGVADDHPAEARQERAQQDEAGAHLGGRLERHEQPVDVACGHLVGVGARGDRRPRRGRAASRPSRRRRRSRARW